MPNNLASKKRETAREHFLQQVEKCMLMGEWSQARLATRFNRHVSTICRAMSIVRDRWRMDDRTDMVENRRYRIKQLEEAYREAMNAWEKSKSVKVEKTVKSEPCSFCRSTGTFTDKDGEVLDCPLCSGSGVKIEMQTKKSRSYGDSGYLNAALRAHKEISLLEAAYPERVHSGKRTSFSASFSPDGTMKIESVYEDAETEDLLNVMSAIEELKINAEQRRKGSIIDVEATKKIEASAHTN